MIAYIYIIYIYGKIDYLLTEYIFYFNIFIHCIKQLTDLTCLPKRMFIIFIIYFTNSFALSLPLGPFLRLIQIRSFKLIICFVN